MPCGLNVLSLEVSSGSGVSAEVVGFLGLRSSGMGKALTRLVFHFARGIWRVAERMNCGRGGRKRRGDGDGAKDD